MQELNLCDPWRRMNPGGREYSCCSTVTKTHSQIDIFFISDDLYPRVKSYLISDHGPVSIDYKDSKLTKGSFRWRLHPKWLYDPSFLDFVGFNKAQTSASIRWEAFKAYIRGQIIS